MTSNDILEKYQFIDITGSIPKIQLYYHELYDENQSMPYSYNFKEIFNLTQINDLNNIYYSLKNSTEKYLINSSMFYSFKSDLDVGSFNTETQITENVLDTDEIDNIIYDVDKIWQKSSKISKHANDITFTEESLIGFISKIHDNIGDNYHFVSTSDMAERRAENENYVFIDYEKEIEDAFPSSNMNIGWNKGNIAKICIINNEFQKILPLDSDDNRNSGRYTWVRGGSLLNFATDYTNYSIDNRPIGTIWVDENNGVKQHSVLVKGFDVNGNFNNRNPSNYNQPSQNPLSSITTNNVYADTVQTDKIIANDASFNKLSLNDNEDEIGLYIHNDSEAYRRSGIRTYDEWTKTEISDDSFADYNIITNIPYQELTAPEVNISDIDGAQPFSETEDGYWQSGNNSTPKVSLCKINFLTDRPMQVELIYQNDGYSNKNYSIISDLNKDLSTSTIADSQWVALNLKNNFSTEDRIYEIYIPAGESYIICKHIMTQTSSSYNKGYFKFKINFKEIKNFSRIQYYTHPTSNLNQVEFHSIPFEINPNNYYIKVGYNKWKTCLNNELFNQSNVEILHKFIGGPTFEYIGEEEFVSFPNMGDIENWQLNYNLDYPLWWNHSEEGVYVRISKTLLSAEDYIYALYNPLIQSYNYYRITDIIQPTNDINEIEYTFTQIETPEDIALYSSPGPASMFKRGYHYDLNVGNSIYNINNDYITYYIDDISISYPSADTTLDDPNGIHTLEPVYLNRINNIDIIDTSNKKYFDLDYDLTNLFTKDENSDEQYIPVAYGIDYSNDLDNFYLQTSFDNEVSQDDDPALGNINPHEILGSICTDGGIAAKKSIKGFRVHAAVFNDYAEYRQTDSAAPGRCVVEVGDGNMILSIKRLQPGANIVSDTFGFSIGETHLAQTPIAVCGRVLTYPFEDKEIYEPGDAVCSGPNGTISKMTREEIKEWPDRIVGYVSEIPTYKYWGSNKVEVNGRIWIKIK